MSTIDIEYCVPCGMRDQAVNIQEAILAAVEEDVDQVSLTPGHGGVVIVSVDGDHVFHSGEDDYDPDTVIERIVDDVRQQL